MGKNVFCRAVVALMLVLFALPSFAALSDEKIGAFRAKSKSFDTIYDLYDMVETNAYNLLDEREFKALARETDAAVAESVKKNVAAGKNEADAYAVAYGERILAITRDLARKLPGKTPLEGYYELEDAAATGYMVVSSNVSDASKEKGEHFSLEFLVWRKDKPAKVGRCLATAARVQAKTVTSSVEIMDGTPEEASRDPKVQISVSFDAGTATVKTTDGFRKGRFLSGGTGESFRKSEVVIDGKYVLKK